MKLATAQGATGTYVALEAGGEWIDFTKAHQVHHLLAHGTPGPILNDLGRMFREGLVRSEHVEPVVSRLEEYALMERFGLAEAPLGLQPHRPGKILCIGRNYSAHAAETGHEAPTQPVVFSKSPAACIGPGCPIRIRETYGRVDHEGELAVVIGKRAKDVRRENALDCVAGYTIVNDVTARDIQQQDIGKGLPWFLSKSMDSFCPMGPALLLTDALVEPLEADVEVWVNGELRQQSNTRRLIFDIPVLIAYMTQYITLEPGDIIATGTPEGIAPLVPGDQVEVTIPPIGTLSNPVEAEPPL